LFTQLSVQWGAIEIEDKIKMNWDIIEGKWNQFKGEAQAKWGKLTDDDLDVIAGKQQKLIGRLQERYGYNKDKAEKAVEEWQSKINN